MTCSATRRQRTGLALRATAGALVAIALATTGRGFVRATAPALPISEGVVCRWRETTLRAAADACALSADLFGNYGDEGRLCVGLGQAGSWRSLIGFNLDPSRPDGALLDATLRLFLKEATGDRRNTIRACRAGLTWTERGVTWRTLPAAAAPCADTEVGTELRFYDWDVTEFVRGFRGEQWEDYGFLLQSANEFQVNERSFHDRQSRDGRSQPQLVVRTIPVPAGITATVTVAPEPAGGVVTVRLKNDALPGGVYDIEWFTAEQTPAWRWVEPLLVPDGWTAEGLSANCLAGGQTVSSEGLWDHTALQPLMVGEELVFSLRFEASGLPASGLPDRLVMHVSDESGNTLGRLIAVPTLAPPTPTATASPTSTMAPPTATPTSSPTWATVPPTATATPTVGEATATSATTPTPSATDSPTAGPGPPSATTPSTRLTLFLPYLEVRVRR